jgi:hypothetical protein
MIGQLRTAPIIARLVSLPWPATPRNAWSLNAPRGRIDGLGAATIAMGAAVKIAPKKESAYKTRGLFR